MRSWVEVVKGWRLYIFGGDFLLLDWLDGWFGLLRQVDSDRLCVDQLSIDQVEMLLCFVRVSVFCEEACSRV